MNWIFAIAFLISGFHPVYVSFNTLELDDDEDKLILMSRLFYDDLTKAAKNAYNVTGMPEDTLAKEQDLNLLIRYYKDKVGIVVNDVEVPDSLITFEKHEISGAGKEDMTIRLFFSIPLDENGIKSIKIRNSVLTELYHGQSNLLITNIYNKQESFRLNLDKKEVTLNVNE
jgi:hypothetical protein